MIETDLGWDIGTVAEFATSEAGRTLLEARSILDDLHKRVLFQVDNTLADATAAYGSLRTGVEAVPMNAMGRAAQHISNLISDQLANVDTALGRAQMNINYLVDRVGANRYCDITIAGECGIVNPATIDYLINHDCHERFLSYEEAEKRFREIKQEGFEKGVYVDGWIESFEDVDASGQKRVYYCPKLHGVIPRGPQPTTDTTSSPPPSPSPAPTPPTEETPSPSADESCPWQELGPFFDHNTFRDTINELERSCPETHQFEYQEELRPHPDAVLSGGYAWYLKYRCCPKSTPTTPPVPPYPSPSPTSPPYPSAPTTPPVPPPPSPAPVAPQCPPAQSACPPPTVNVTVTCPGATVTTDTTPATAPGTGGTGAGGTTSAGGGTRPDSSGGGAGSEEQLSCSIPSLRVGCLVIHYEESSDENVLRQKAETIIATLKIANKDKRYTYTIANCRNRYVLIICEDTSSADEKCPILYQEGDKYTPKPEYLVTSLPDADDVSCKRIAPLGSDFWRLAVQSELRIEKDGWFFDTVPSS